MLGQTVKRAQGPKKDKKQLIKEKDHEQEL